MVERAEVVLAVGIVVVGEGLERHDLSENGGLGPIGQGGDPGGHEALGDRGKLDARSRESKDQKSRTPSMLRLIRSIYRWNADAMRSASRSLIVVGGHAIKLSRWGRSGTMNGKA